jgi:hypothetical protein
MASGVVIWVFLAVPLNVVVTVRFALVEVTKVIAPNLVAVVIVNAHHIV